MPVETTSPPEVIPGREISPGILDQLDEDLARPWVTILYNDDWHPFDVVVVQVQRATGCSLEKAAWITHEAHTTGRAVAYSGTLEECERVASLLRAIQLQVETDRA
jgi:ATP-dependent Clp protease adapter protein ClpS